jgi:hypothetical protein
LSGIVVRDRDMNQMRGKEPNEGKRGEKINPREEE